MAAVDVVGRDAELTAIRGLVDAPRAGGMLLRGEPGIGKTVLWEVGVDEARRKGWRVLEHRGAQAEAGLSFTGLSDLLADAFDQVAETLAAPRRRALEVALLLADPRGAPPDSRAIGLGLLDVLRALSADGPVMLALDDIQWLDASSAAVVALAVRRLGDEAVTVLATRRTQPGATSDGASFDGRLEQITLPPLAPAAMERLLRNALDRELPRATLVAIERACGGNPFFAVELARSARREAGEPHVRVPESLREVLSGRLDRLPDATRAVLLDVAALARPTLEIVAPDASASAAFDVAVTEGVVRLDGSNVRFAHPLLGSLTYDRAPPGLRRSVHARLARLVSDPEERARHLALAAGEARDEGLAADLDAASRHAAARGATAAAADLAELAVRHTPSAHHDAMTARRILAARLHHQAGDIDRAADIYEALLPGLPAGPLRADVLYGDALTQRPDVPSRIALLEEALAVGGDDDVRVAELLGFLAINRWLAGQVVQGVEDGREGLRRAERVGDPRLLVTAIARAGWVEIWGLGRTPGMLERGMELEGRLGAPTRFQDSPRFTFACQCWQADRLDLAAEILEDFAASAERRGDEVARGFAMVVLGTVEREAGRIELAVDRLDAVLHLAEQIAEPQLQLLATTFGARALLDAGRLEEARRHAQHGVALTSAVKDVTHGTVAEIVLGQIDFMRGDLQAARDRLADMPERLLAQGSGAPINTPWAEAIESLIGLGELRRAEELLGLLDDVAPRANRYGRLLAARSRGLLRLARDDVEGAVEALHAALAEEGDTYPLERGRTFLALGTTYRRTRRLRAAKQAIADAERIFEDIGARAWHQRAGEELAHIGGRRTRGDELTDAERRVAALAAQGMQNKEIAATQYLGIGTVEKHLTSVYRKLGIRSRTELATRFADAGVGRPEV
jgi:DNA-binding CsgD family transcriptional regulator